MGDSSRVDLKRMQGEVQTKAISSNNAPRRIIGYEINVVPKSSQPFIRRSLFSRIIRRRRHVAKQTSNGIESFNGQMIRSMAASHPTIWKLIDGLRMEFALAEQRVVAYWSGENTPRRGIAYRKSSQRIFNVVKRYGEIPSKLEYLQAIARNLGGMTIGIINNSQVIAPKKKKTDSGPPEKKTKSDEQIEVIEVKDDVVNVNIEGVIANKFGIVLRKEDLERLEPEQKLNNKLIDYYFQLVVQRSKEDLDLPMVFALDTLFYAQLEVKGPQEMIKQRVWDDVDLFFYDVILIPIHTPGHWTMVAVKMDKQRLVFYDSFHGNGNTHLFLIKQFLQEAAEGKGHKLLEPLYWMGCQNKAFETQENDYDCGVYICKFAECVSREGNIDVLRDEVDELRTQMKQEIIRGQFI